MYKQTKIMATFLLLVVGFFAQTANAAGWSGVMTVTYVTVYGEDSKILVGTSDGSVYATGCVANQWIFSADTDARRDRVLSVLMSALHTGKKVAFWYGDSCGLWDYHIAYTVQAKNY